MGFTYHRKNRRKYSLKVHIVLVTKYRRKLFNANLSHTVKAIVKKIATENDFSIITMQTDKDHIHLLVDYDTTQTVADIVKCIKQKSTYYLWQRYAVLLSQHYWKKRVFWSDGYFACSVGEASSSTIQHYIESQG